MDERTRDAVDGELTLSYFAGRAAQGWKLAAIEWVREVQTVSEPAGQRLGILEQRDTVPYGLKLSGSDSHLEENPLEMTVLLLILEQIVKEKRISEIARRLNETGHKTREGRAWSAPAVFDLLPRLIEVGPALLKSSAWEQLRPAAIGRSAH